MLSVAFIDRVRFVAGESTGGLLLGDVSQEAPALSILGRTERDVCALQALPNGELAGLVANGTLLIWRAPDFQHCSSIEIPALPEHGALVNLRYWPDENAVVFPCRGGYLGLLKLDSKKIRVRQVHDGDFYATFLRGQELATIGFEDGRLRLWSAGREEPQREALAPSRVVSARGVWNMPDNLLLVDENGAAGIHALAEDRLQPVERLAGGDYRTVVSPAPPALAAYARQQREAKVEQVIAAIQDRGARRQVAGLSELHAELVRLGQEPVSLRLRAEAARDREDLLAELGCYHQLMTRIPRNGARRSAERHAKLLEQAGQPAAALRVNQDLEQSETDRLARDSLSRLSAKAKAMADGRGVIDREHATLEILVRAASLLEKPFTCHYLIKSHPPHHCLDASFAPADLVRQCERLRRDPAAENAPRAKVMPLQFVSPQAAGECSETVIFNRRMSGELAGLSLALRVHHEDHFTVITPMTLFDAAAIKPATPYDEHNRRVLEAYERIIQRQTTNPWLSKVHKMALTAIKQLTNRADAKKLNGGL